MYDLISMERCANMNLILAISEMYRN